MIVDDHLHKLSVSVSTPDSSALVSCDADVCLQPLKPSVSRRRKGSSSVSVVGGSRLKRQPSRLTPVSLSGIGGRDSALFLFRALGKILHCKRTCNNYNYIRQWNLLR